MSYFPKSQINPNLYTNGDEYVISSTKETYQGYYYETSNGEKYTGKNPNSPPNLLLVSINTSPNLPQLTNQFLPNVVESYSNSQSGNDFSITEFPINTSLLDITRYSDPINSSPRSLPTPIQTPPTQQDKDLGVFSRYFCKKNNENIYIEIDKEQFTKFQNRDEDVAWDLYTPKQVLWQIEGDKTQTYNANKNNISLIEQRDKWYGFTQYFKDRFLKYYLES
jgi:hypothetical protein